MFYEMKVTLLVKHSKHHLDIQELIGQWINRAQLADPEFKKTHYDQAYKFYHFSSLYPLEKGGVYQKGRAYILTIRSSIKETMSRIKTCLQNSREDEYFQLIACEQRKRQILHITEMITITPAIVTIENKPWLHESSIELLMQQLHANAEKKYKCLNPKSEDQRSQLFINSIHIENHKPIALSYKGRKMLGNKLRLFINEDLYSQELANIVMGSGLAEKGSSIGAGFCLAKSLN
jgi:CRISPR-associated endoribonuclease Cas6